MFDDDTILKENLIAEGYSPTHVVFPKYDATYHNTLQPATFYLYNVEFSIDKNVKSIKQIAENEEEAIWKIKYKYRDSKKPPQNFKFKILDVYG